MSTNPYAAPSADVSNASQQTYQPKLLSGSGRIGRLRYLAYLFTIYVLLALVIGVLGAVSATTGGWGDVGGTILLIVMGILYALFLIFAISFARRRFNDLNMTGWLCLLMLVPLVNLVIFLILVFAPGSPEPNKYGPAPCANPLSVKIAGLAIPLIFVLGILAAIAIPAYQDYVDRTEGFDSSSNLD